MAWIILVVSGALEAVWATALSRMDGFSRPLPLAVFAVSLTASMAGLGWALRTLPVGTAYAVWVAIGASLTAGYAMWTGTEPVSALKLLFIAGIIGCVIGLKLVSDH